MNLTFTSIHYILYPLSNNFPVVFNYVHTKKKMDAKYNKIPHKGAIKYIKETKINPT